MATAAKNSSAPGAAVPDARKRESVQVSGAVPAEAVVAGEKLEPANLVQAYAELQERFRKMTGALASATHDLKTPLAILNGYVDLLHSEKLGPVNERQRQVLRDMQLSGKRLEQFIQDFLTLAALETGGLVVNKVPGDLNQCLADVCQMWSNRLQQRRIALYLLANEKLPELSFDAPKVERVISNLLENAGKYTPEGGTVWVHAEPHMWERRAAALARVPAERRQRSSPTPNAAKVSVSDTGPGIPPEFQQEVFDDFFRLPGSEAKDGIGLGLAISRRLVQCMGGKIWVESEPGTGCKFSFLIPISEPSSANRKAKAE
jgi:signal transduction histidine kinase